MDTMEEAKQQTAMRLQRAAEALACGMMGGGEEPDCDEAGDRNFTVQPSGVRVCQCARRESANSPVRVRAAFACSRELPQESGDAPLTDLKTV